jgi:hypothetical protein
LNAPPRGITLRESTRNLVAHRFTSIVLVALSAVVGATIIVTTTADISSIIATQDKQLARGVNLLNVSTNDSDMLATECASLQSIGGVTASGAVLNTASGNSKTTPTSQFTVDEVTPGFLHAMFPSLSPADVVVAGHSLASAQGLTPGSDLIYRDAAGVQRVAHVDAVAPDVARADGLGLTLFRAQAPIGTVDNCLVAAVPGMRDRISAVVPSFFTIPVQVAPLVHANELEIDPEGELHVRISQLGWAVGGAFLSALVLLLMWSRRREFSIYRLSGFNRLHTGTIAGVEALLVIVIPGQYGAVVAAIAELQGKSAVVWRAVAADDARFILVLCFASALTGLMAARGSTLARLRGAL